MSGLRPQRSGHVSIFRPLEVIVPLTQVTISTSTILDNWRDLSNFHALRWVVIDDGADVAQVTLDTSEDPNATKAVDTDHQWNVTVPAKAGSVPGQNSILLGQGPNSPELLNTYFRLIAQTPSPTFNSAVVRWMLLGSPRF